MKNKMKLRILSALLCLALLLGGAPTFADETTQVTSAAATGAEASIEVQSPAEAPAESGAAESGGAAPESPAEGSGEAPADTPAEGSGEAPADTPAEGSGEAPADTPAEGNGEASAEDALVAQQAAQLEEAVLQWVSALNGQGLSGDYARALWLYDRLMANVAPGADSTAHAALVMGSADATGYAQALEALMTAAGLECRVVAAEDGAWNVALLDGEWTHIDAFMDDCEGGFGRHFALTDAAMARDHSLTDPELPACTGTAANYYVRSQGYLAYDGLEALRALLSAAVDSQADALKLYNAGAAIESLEEKINTLLAELAPATATVEQDGFLATIQIHYAVSEVLVASAPEIATVLPESIVPAAESLTLGVKEKASVADWTLLPEGAQDSVSYSSKSTRIATVSAEGVVTAKAAGSTTITIRTASGASCVVKVTVKKAPTSVSIYGDRKVLGVGETMQLGYKLSRGSAGKATFTCAGEAATVTPEGLLTAVQPGVATVTVTTFNGKKKSASIEIKPAPEGVQPAAERLSIGAEDSYTLGYALSEGSAGAVSFASSNPEVASVDANGRISALKQGEADVTVTTYNGKSGTCHVTVVPAPEAISLTADRTTLGLKEKLTLTAAMQPEGTVGTLKFSSSKSSVASVDANGVVTAKKAGSATITVSTYNGRKASVKISVKKAPTSVRIYGDRKVLGVGETMQLGYKLSSGSAGKATFTCAGDAATVTPEGLLTAVQPGTATVTVTTFNGKKKSANIEIKPAPTSISVGTTQLALGEGDRRTLVAALNEGSAGLIRFRSENPEVATVNEKTGEITALHCGVAQIVAYTYVPGVEAKATLEVVPAPSSVTLPYKTLNLGLGDSLKLQPEIDPGSATTFSYSSSSSKYVKVSADGTVRGARTGKATVTIRTHNGRSFKLSVYVKKAPTSVKANPATMKLGVGETMLLRGTLSSGSATTLRYESKSPDVAVVDETGLVRAVAPGEAVIELTTHNGKKAQCKVTVCPAPESISLSLPDVMGVGQKAASTISLSPAESYSNVKLSVISGDAMEIDNSGNVRAVRAGTAVVRAETHVPGVHADREILVKPAPKSISFPQNRYTVNVGETLQLNPTVDADAYTTLTYTLQKSGFFTVDANGLVTPVRRGSAAVKVTTHNGLSATATVVVVDPNYPEMVELAETPPQYLEPGETYTPVVTVFPETAISGLVWSSSDAEIASVNAETGKVTAHSFGRATITGKSSRNPSLTLSYKLIVLSNARCLQMPARRTSISEISATQTQIKNVRASAYRELESLCAKGVISQSEANTRRGYIERAFDMYLMPWMTETKELYWKAANSENGAKDFKPGIVYHGMPYTQANRVNSKTSAVSKGYYKDTGKGYYLMNGAKFASRNYPGNDCSSFVSIAIWGINSSRASNNTNSIGSASYYKTKTNWKDLRPGDLLNKPSKHVVMFLYYANEEKTQIVIIEQGGGEAGTNTVSCSIRDVSYYTSRGYSIRRVSTLA